MLIVERQGESECMLATIAALTGRTLAEIRSVACYRAGVRKWSSMTRGPKRYQYWATVRQMASEYSADLVAAVAEHGYPVAERGVTESAHVPAVGRGTVKTQRMDRRVAHIMPFENGLIHDPTEADPNKGMTESEWLAANPDWRIRAVRTLPAYVNPEDSPEAFPLF